MNVVNYGTIFVTIADADKEEALPLIRRFSFYKGIKQGKDLYEAATAMDFDSLEALAEFQASPAHHDPDSRAFCELVRERKAVIDFEIQENQ